MNEKLHQQEPEFTPFKAEDQSVSHEQFNSAAVPQFRAKVSGPEPRARSFPPRTYSMNRECRELGRPIRVLALIEATTVTGPAKNIIELCRRARHLGAAEGDPSTTQITVVTFDRSSSADGQAPNAFVQAALAAGVQVEVIKERFRFDTRVLTALSHLVRNRRPDIIQTHMVKSHFLVRLLRLWRGRPWIAFHHGYTSTDLKMELYNRLDSWSLPKADRVVTVCGAFAEQLTRIGVHREKIVIRHNSVSGAGTPSSSETRQLRDRLGLNCTERVILAVGRLSREKGHSDLFEALGRLRASPDGTNVRLVLVGDGPEREPLQRIAVTHGIGDSIVFAGHVSDVRPFYAIADVLALPSHSEGSPNVLLEAMAGGLPIVATAVGGVPEIVDHERTALLVPARDPAAMARAIERMLQDRELAARIATSASEVVMERFTPEAYAESIVAIYADAWHSRRA
jgi:glycosyltransferase involved in cell wall biosynthesis